MQPISDLLEHREDNRLEVKDARKGLPSSLWDTYSSFANTNGGIILLGVAETSEGALVPVGLPDAERTVKEIWDAVNSKDTVNVNILVDSDIRIVELEGARIVRIDVPRADMHVRPVYRKDNPYAGSFRRNGEGDYHCSTDEVNAMIRDAGSGVEDNAPLEGFDIDSLCAETIQRYRSELTVHRPTHPWLRLNDPDLLVRIGAAALDNRGVLRPTRAGLLMFGWEYEIVRECPFFFLDFRLVEGGRRWDDRIVSSDGEWSGNVFDFWNKVSARLVEDLRRPFAVDGRFFREDDTPFHRALREGLTNMLLHADYFGTTSCSAVKTPEKVVFSNPGTMLVAPEVAMSGGASLTRNPALARMFNLVALGEKAGSGFDAMWQGCEWAGFAKPILHEEFELGRVRLEMPLVSERARFERGETQAAAVFGARDASSAVHIMGAASNEEKVVELLRAEGTATRSSIQLALGVSKATANNVLAVLVERGVVERRGSGRSTRYSLS